MSAPLVSALTDPAVELRDVTVAHGQSIVLQVKHLRIERGERVVLVGPNGAGKSTLFRILSGQLCPADGTVQVLGHERRFSSPSGTKNSRPRYDHRVGIISQGLHLVPRLDALSNTLIGGLARADVAAWRSWLKWFPSGLIDEAMDALAQVGMQDHATTRADHLSGGERQRVAMARLIMQKPELILADEPTAALDPAATARAVSLLNRLARGATLLTIVHEMTLVGELGDRVIGIRQGQIALDTPSGQLGADAMEALFRAPAPGKEPDEPSMGALSEQWV